MGAMAHARVFTSQDANIVKQFARYVYLTPTRLARITGLGLGALDPSQAMRKRVQRLRAAGIVESLLLPDERFGENVSRLTTKGWMKARELGAIDHAVKGTDSRSNKNLRHELDLTDFHLALDRALGSDLQFWYQRKSELHDRWSDEEDDRVNPDAFFGLRVGSRMYPFFLEWELSDEHSYESRKSILIRKCEAYRHYATGPFSETWGLRGFGVLVVVPTASRVERVAERLRAFDIDTAGIKIINRSTALADPRPVLCPDEIGPKERIEPEAPLEGEFWTGGV